MPRSRSVPRSPSFSAPVTVVVTPLECQSNPRTHPNAWNQCGSDSRRSTSSLPYSATMCVVISRARRTIREKSHAGARPQCSGRCADPVLMPWAELAPGRVGGGRPLAIEGGRQLDQADEFGAVAVGILAAVGRGQLHGVGPCRVRLEGGIAQ